MDEESSVRGILKWLLGVTGLGAVSAAVFLPFPGNLIIVGFILALFLVLFGGYYLWQRRRARRQREQFSSALEAQTAAAPKAISDPNKRADLDRVRQKFQAGMQEFKSRGKDIYKLPWFVIIGESGSGKTEAIRNSGIEFPPGLQDQLQGSGGTVNMDWWFTNLGIILDTAGSMIFNEARAGESPEWREFLRLLKRSRPHCPINGLFLVLSVESLIKDSADKIADKASRLAQQLDLIQRTLDVRFPVYLFVTKCDLLTGFREFFDNIDDPLLQHQMFGWSNPDPLDAHFRPDLVEQNLQGVAARLRRRRMALIRDTSGTGRLGDTQHFFASTYQLGQGPTVRRRLDEVDALFALPESVMRLAPRLRRYLETIFVAGEWSAKPVFLRGIYFTSSMREGKALDEAIALATGLPLDQLPEDRSWEKNRAFFLCDLFKEKVFRESGLVTRATNTLKLLRQRQLAIFGSAGVALLLLLVFAGFAHRKLNQSVRTQVAYWQAGAASLKPGAAWPAIVSDTPASNFRFLYGGTNLVPGMDPLTLAEYHRKLKETADRPLEVSWIFQPMKWINAGSVQARPEAQRLLFERSVLKPLIERTRTKMIQSEPPQGSPAGLARHRDALVSLMEFEGDALETSVGGEALMDSAAARRYLRNFLAYLTEEDVQPDTNLVHVMALTYSKEALRQNGGAWPPKALLGGNTLASNPALDRGLFNFQKASVTAQTNIEHQLKLTDDLVDKLSDYHSRERNWLANPGGDPCATFNSTLKPAKEEADAKWRAFESATNFPTGLATNLSSRYQVLAAAATEASASVFATPVAKIMVRLPPAQVSAGLFAEIKAKLDQLVGSAAENVLGHARPRAEALALIDTNCVVRLTNNLTAYEARWELYQGACALASARPAPEEADIGQGWKRFSDMNRLAAEYQTKLALYHGPMAAQADAACKRIAADALRQLKTGYVDEYLKLADAKLQQLGRSTWTAETVTNAGHWLVRIRADLNAGPGQGIAEASLQKLNASFLTARDGILAGIDRHLAGAVGFPIALDSDRVRSAAELAPLRRLLQSLTSELQQPIWEGCASQGALRASCGRYASVVNALLKEDNNPAEWELRFVPPAQDQDKRLIVVYRYARVAFGARQSDWIELSHLENVFPLGTAPVDAPLAISFKKLMSDSTERPGPSYSVWGLPEIIRKGTSGLERFDDGLRWRFRIKLDDAQEGAGNVTFEAVLKRPLPKREEWPGAK